jgi:SpoVK/Ycf46/Vps4 family AAA+-type ATPase
MYIATTNYIDKIPARVRRPGRFSSVIKVGFPNAKARAHYLSTKLKDKAMIASIVERTDGFSIDELKEVVRGVYCMGKDLDSYIQYVKPNNNKQQDMDDDDDFFDDDSHYRRSAIEDETNKLSLALRRFAKATGKN